MNLNSLTPADLKKALPSAKKKLEYQPTPHLTREQKVERLQQLRVTIAGKQSTNPPDQQATGG